MIKQMRNKPSSARMNFGNMVFVHRINYFGLWLVGAAFQPRWLVLPPSTFDRGCKAAPTTLTLDEYNRRYLKNVFWLKLFVGRSV
jgi:hypothetical protein